MFQTAGSCASLCARGWHTVAVHGDVAYFRFGARLRDGNGAGTIIYRTGPVPFEEACTTIWCYGDQGKPWVCSSCRQPITERAIRQN